MNQSLSIDSYVSSYSKQSKNKKVGGVNVVELGCGFGYLTETLRTLGLNSIGIDISSIAINKARTLHPDSNFRIDQYNNFDFFYRFKPNVFICAEITWYVLDTIDQFILDLKKYARSQLHPTYLIHLLSTYPEGVQKYGRHFFTDYSEILKYFDLEYIESGFTQVSRIDDRDSQGTYFIARL